MLRLSPPGFERLFQSPVLSATFGGGEANVAVSLAQFGLESQYVTRLPSHAIGEAALRALRRGGQTNNTLILFLSDNGGCAEEIPAAWRGVMFPRATRAGRPTPPAGSGAASQREAPPAARGRGGEGAR